MPEETSLDRYLETRAGYVLGHLSARHGLKVMGFVGVAMLLVGMVFMVIALATGAYDVIAGGIGPTIAGLVNLILSQTLKHRAKPAIEVNAELTPQARTFLAELMRDVYDWPYAWGANDPSHIWSDPTPVGRIRRKRERRAWRRMFGARSWGVRQHSAKEELNPAAFEALNAGAFQYNRIAGVLEASNPALAKFVPTVRAAADQAMADLFHVTSAMDRYPETAETHQPEADKLIASLAELAERVESLQKTSAAGALSGTNPIESVLEELRLEQLARSELATPTAEEQAEQRA